MSTLQDGVKNSDAPSDSVELLESKLELAELENLHQSGRQYLVHLSDQYRRDGERTQLRRGVSIFLLWDEDSSGVDDEAQRPSK